MNNRSKFDDMDSNEESNSGSDEEAEVQRRLTEQRKKASDRRTRKSR